MKIISKETLKNIENNLRILQKHVMNMDVAEFIEAEDAVCEILVALDLPFDEDA